MNKKLLKIIIVALLICGTAAFFIIKKIKDDAAAELAQRIKIDSLRMAQEAKRIQLREDSLRKSGAYQNDTVFLQNKPGFPRQLFARSNYQNGAQGSLEELETDGGYIFKIQSLVGDNRNEMHFEIKNKFLSSTVTDPTDWFFQLQFDLAQIKGRASSLPFDVDDAMLAARAASKLYPSHSDAKYIRPFAFKGGELKLEEISTDGRYTNLKFTIFILKNQTTL